MNPRWKCNVAARTETCGMGTTRDTVLVLLNPVEQYHNSSKSRPCIEQAIQNSVFTPAVLENSSGHRHKIA